MVTPIVNNHKFTTHCVIFPMTTVLVLARSLRRMRVEGILRWAVLVCLAPGLPANAQDRPVHWLHAGAMPPGAIGSLRLHRGGPLLGYFQPVRIRAPQGARIALGMEASTGSLAADAVASEARSQHDVLVGMRIGAVYRLTVTNIPNNPGLEIFPTLELIDRLYPPSGLALRYPIPIELTLEELELAARGAFVTRVIYIEDPYQALPVQYNRDNDQPWMEALPGEDPLVTADRFGRPVAILRIGGRVPSDVGDISADPYGAPPVIRYAASQPSPPYEPIVVGDADENPSILGGGSDADESSLFEVHRQ